MKLKKLVITAVLGLFAGQSIGLTALADEGMWPFNNVPRSEIKKKYGFDITDEWLKKVQLSSVRFNNGGSGSFVSPDGLVMTNHHIAQDTLQKISNEKKDYFEDGFYAATPDQEAPAPDLELNVLQRIEDVTSRINGVVKPGMSDAEANDARKREINAISEEATKATGLRADVVTLYQGGQYNLYLYKKYTDVRLVFAPEFKIAFFGGDPDNFEFPRYDLDVAFFRVYENGKPIHIDNYFKWSKAGAKVDELTFVSGHPGSTSRLNTVANLEYLRDYGFPLLLKYLERERKLLQNYGAQGEEQRRRSLEELFSIENSLKARKGGLEGLQDKAIMARKRQDEQNLRKRIAANPSLQKEYGDAWDEIARARKSLESFERQRRFIAGGWGFNTTYFGTALTLVRLGTESAKPNSERLPGYTDAARASLELSLFSPAPIYDDFEKVKLADSLSFLRDELGANDQFVKEVLAGKTPEARAAELIDGTKLKDVEFRKQLAKGGAEAIQASTDPMIVLARMVDPQARMIQKRYDDEVVGVERTNYARIAKALFALEGTSLYPDATFTLRLSYGPVKGYKVNGRTIAPFTNLEGLYKHAADHGNKYPYEIPKSWMDKKGELNLKTPFDFVSTADIIGGNSGSPVFNRNAEIVGLIFDGNIQSLVGDFIYDETQNRAVSVDSRAIMEALNKVYGAKALAAELSGS